MQAGQLLHLAFIGQGLPHRHTVVFEHVNIHAVARAFAVRCEHGVLPVVGIDEQEIVERRRIREPEVHGHVPVVRFRVPVRYIQVVAAHPVQSARGEIKGFPVGRQHRENLVRLAGNLLVDKFRNGPQRIQVTRPVEVADSILVHRGIIQRPRIRVDIHRPLPEGIQGVGIGPPGAVFQGIVQEEILARKALARHHHGPAAVLHHTQGVLAQQEAVLIRPGKGGIAQAERLPIGIHRFGEGIGAAEGIAPGQQARSRPDGTAGQGIVRIPGNKRSIGSGLVEGRPEESRDGTEGVFPSAHHLLQGIHPGHNPVGLPERIRNRLGDQRQQARQKGCNHGCKPMYSCFCHPFRCLIVTAKIANYSQKISLLGKK